ncbi:MAG: glycerophosphodiester phosphodiesterase family protein [Parvularculaceae bacterium]
MIAWLGRLLAAIVIAVAGVWLANASFWSSYSAPITVLAHRGLAQTYHREGLTNKTCTATRIDAPEHPYLENTIDSIAAAFAVGADVVEFDIHPTTDGEFAVFHDWTLDCRTNGSGVTREQSMAYLKTLDIGHGYTADGGKTFPFRGKFKGAMPTLDEALARFPDKRFLINIKANDRRTGELLAARLKELPPARRALLTSYGGDRSMRALLEAMPELRVMGRRQYTTCMFGYLKIGWLGRTPKACRNTIVLVPMNYAFLGWGWPNRFVERMHAAGSEVYVIGPYERGDPGTAGVDTLEQAGRIPRNFPGGVWTNRVDLVGPLLKAEPAEP